MAESFTNTNTKHVTHAQGITSSSRQIHGIIA